MEIPILIPDREPSFVTSLISGFSQLICGLAKNPKRIPCENPLPVIRIKDNMMRKTTFAMEGSFIIFTFIFFILEYYVVKISLKILKR
jgi:hypothetical protein